MNLKEYRVIFVVVIGVLALIVASPGLSRLLVLPRTEFFSEFWILGPNHRAENYPSNVSHNDNYSIFLGIGNRLSYVAYYLVEVKFRGLNQSAPEGFDGTPSNLPSLFNITAFVADEGVWEMPLTFSFDYGYNETLSQVNFESLVLNDVILDMKTYVLSWDSVKQGFFGFLFFELWLYDVDSESFQFHERTVGLLVNMIV